MSDAFQNAMALAARGYAVLPLYGVTERDGALVCMCGNPECGKTSGKHPHGRLAPNGTKDATTNLLQIKEWHGAIPGLNWGMVTGPLVVLDQDGTAGATAIGRLQKVRRFPPTWRVSTGRDHGLHYYFRAPDGVAIPCSVGKIDKGIDVRGVGGYVVIAGSRHLCGNYYAWWQDWHPSKRLPALFPTWILEQAKAKNSKGNGARPIEEWRALAEGKVGEGERNDTLARFAGHLLNGFNDTGVVHTLLQAWNQVHCVPPLPADEVENTVASIAERELNKRVQA